MRISASDCLKRLWSDETGQSTTEYILILSVVVMIAMKFRTAFSGQLTTLLNKLNGDLQQAADSSQQ